MATLPSFPVFAENDSSIAKLNELASAVNFLYNCSTRPVWHFHSETTQTLDSGWTVVQFPSNSYNYDSDGVNSGAGGANIVTRGYYSVESCVQFTVNGSGIGLGAGFLFTAGSNNPHFSENSAIRFGIRARAPSGTSATDNSITPSDMVPVCCYPGDVLQAQAYCTAGITLRNNTNTSYTQGRFVLNFTGYYVAYGT
jgi:hypothetical protein